MTRDEYDAALKRGIRLGLEAAENAIVSCAFHDDFPARQWPLRLATLRLTIFALDPDTIAREAQDMGSDTSAGTTA